nr:hypothetical protein [Tanacetum cinerariifolium]
MRLVTHVLEGCEFENTCNNDKSLSEIQLEHEKEDELVVVVVKVVHELDYMMVMKEIEDGLLKEMGVSLFGKKVMILEWMSCASILVLPTFLVFKRSLDGGLSKTLVVRVKMIGRRGSRGGLAKQGSSSMRLCIAWSKIQKK